MTVWLNGKFIADDGVAQIAINDRGFLLGDGLFETLLLIDGQPVFLEQHLSRFGVSAQMLGMELTLLEETVLAAVQRLVTDADLHTGRGVLRISLSRGTGPRGLLPPSKPELVLLMSVAPAPPEDPTATPVKTHISTIRRNEGSPASQLKSLSYVDNIMARQGASAAGFGEAIMLNNAGQVCCATIGNLFWISPKLELVTPELEAGVLPGIVRAEILTIALDQDIAVTEGEVTPENLATGLSFMTNSLIGLRQLAVEGAMPGETCQALFKDLATAYSEIVQQYLSTSE